MKKYVDIERLKELKDEGNNSFFDLWDLEDFLDSISEKDILFVEEKETNTNYDRIKSMSVEELTSVILMLSERVKKYPNARITLVKQWLLQEVSENE